MSHQRREWRDTIGLHLMLCIAWHRHVPDSLCLTVIRAIRPTAQHSTAPHGSALSTHRIVNDARFQHNLRLLHFYSQGCDRAAEREPVTLRCACDQSEHLARCDSCHSTRAAPSPLPPLPPPLMLTCSVRFTQADLGDAARVTLRSAPLQHAVLLLLRPGGGARCHGGRGEAGRRSQRRPRSPASSGGAASLWLRGCSCSSGSKTSSSAAGEIHYARSIMAPSCAPRKSPSFQCSPISLDTKS